MQMAAGKAVRAAGLSGVVWHGLRGAAAGWAAEGGASDQAIAAVLGIGRPRPRGGIRGANQRRLEERASVAIVLPFGSNRLVRIGKMRH